MKTHYEDNQPVNQPYKVSRIEGLDMQSLKERYPFKDPDHDTHLSGYDIWTLFNTIEALAKRNRELREALGELFELMHDSCLHHYEGLDRIESLLQRSKESPR